MRIIRLFDFCEFLKCIVSNAVGAKKQPIMDCFPHHDIVEVPNNLGTYLLPRSQVLDFSISLSYY